MEIKIKNNIKENNNNFDKDLDYKNMNLKKYILDNGKRIIPARITKVKKILQKKLSRSIKIARYLSFLPYCDRHKKNII
jgi:small subunit ribosomal protein S18